MTDTQRPADLPAPVSDEWIKIYAEDSEDGR